MRWFSTLHSVPDPQVTLIAFHYGGGNSSAYRNWGRYLPPNVNLLGVDLPGRGARYREPLIDRVEAVVDGLEQGMRLQRSIFATEKLVYFGHSIGALIAYELAKRMIARVGMVPRHLIVSGAMAPHLLRTRPPLHALPKPQFVAELRKYGGTPEAFFQNEELMDLFIPILRSDFAIAETYRMNRLDPLACDLSVYGGSHDTAVSAEGLAAWEVLTTGACEIRMFSGGHFFLHEVERAVVTTVSSVLEKIARDGVGQRVPVS